MFFLTALRSAKGLKFIIEGKGGRAMLSQRQLEILTSVLRQLTKHHREYDNMHREEKRLEDCGVQTGEDSGDESSDMDTLTGGTIEDEGSLWDREGVTEEGSLFKPMPLTVVLVTQHIDYMFD